jgi:AcrR family transcriptional regulator
MARTRSASAHQKVVEAAIELLAERGVETTSMDAIAERSGVSKATIYKHWANKDALLLEAIAEVNELRTRPKFDSGHTRMDMVAVLSYRPDKRTAQREAIMPHFVAYSARNPELGLAWRQMVMEPPRKELRKLFKAGIAKGELSEDLDADISLALLLGPIVYWYVFLRQKSGDPKHLAESVVDAFWRAFGVNRATRAG